MPELCINISEISLESTHYRKTSFLYLCTLVFLESMNKLFNSVNLFHFVKTLKIIIVHFAPILMFFQAQRFSRW